MTSFARSPPATPMAAASMVSVELNGGCISMQQTNIAMEKTQLILKWTVFPVDLIEYIPSKQLFQLFGSWYWTIGSKD